MNNTPTTYEDNLREAEDYEQNARHDYIQEAFGSSAPDGYEEAFGEYEGDLTFAEWKAAEKAHQQAPVTPEPEFPQTDDYPF